MSGLFPEQQVQEAQKWFRGRIVPEGAARGERRRIERFHRWADAIEARAERLRLMEEALRRAEVVSEYLLVELDRLRRLEEALRAIAEYGVDHNDTVTPTPQDIARAALDGGEPRDARFECGCWFSEVGAQRHPVLTGEMCCPIHRKPYGDNPERRPFRGAGER